MGDGLKRAALESIRTRSWNVYGYPLHGDRVVVYYDALKRGDACAAAAANVLVASFPAYAFALHPGLRARVIDRARQVLRKAGLARPVKGSRRWEAV